MQRAGLFSVGFTGLIRLLTNDVLLSDGEFEQLFEQEAKNMKKLKSFQ